MMRLRLDSVRDRDGTAEADYRQDAQRIGWRVWREACSRIEWRLYT